MFFALSLTGYLYFLVGMQFWAADYALQAIIAPKQRIFMSLAICQFLSPLFGSFIGAFIINKAGGASSPQAFGILCLLAFLTTVLSMPLPFITTLAPFIFLISVLLFLVSILQPILVGQLLYTIYQDQRAVGSAVANLFYLLLGFIPSTIVYGLVNRIGNNDHSLSLGFLVYSTVFSSAFLFAALISKL